MRRFLVVAMALSLCVGFAALAVANTKKVNTKVSINFKAGSSYRSLHGGRLLR